MSDQRFCPQCGQANNLTAQFCGHCGRPLPAVQPSGAPPNRWRWFIGGIGLLVIAGVVILVTQMLPERPQPSLAAVPPTAIVTTTTNPVPATNTALPSITPTSSPADPHLSVSPTKTNTPINTSTIIPTSTSTNTPIPTATLMPTATPTITPIPECIGAAPTRLSVGANAKVVNYQLNVRAGPSTQQPVVNRLSIGREVIVREGPQCSDGQLWYYIVADEFINDAGNRVNVEGWSVEESGNVYFLEPTN